MKCKLWTETLEFSRLKVPNSRFALHGLAPPSLTVCAPFLPLIHGLCAFFRLLLTPLSTAPSPQPSQFTVCTSRFARLRNKGSKISGKASEHLSWENFVPRKNYFVPTSFCRHASLTQEVHMCWKVSHFACFCHTDVMTLSNNVVTFLWSSPSRLPLLVSTKLNRKKRNPALNAGRAGFTKKFQSVTAQALCRLLVGLVNIVCQSILLLALNMCPQRSGSGNRFLARGKWGHGQRGKWFWELLISALSWPFWIRNLTQRTPRY